MRKLTTRRTDLMDTSDWAHREMLRRLRAMTPEARLQIAFELTDEIAPDTRQREESELLARFGRGA